MLGDGAKIAFSFDLDGDSEVFVVNSDGIGLKQLINKTAIDHYASIKDDGTKIAYSSNVDGDNESFIVINDVPIPLSKLEA
jgi:Tol biopolymer transport system component